MQSLMQNVATGSSPDNGSPHLNENSCQLSLRVSRNTHTHSSSVSANSQGKVEVARGDQEVATKQEKASLNFSGKLFSI